MSILDRIWDRLMDGSDPPPDLRQALGDAPVSVPRLPPDVNPVPGDRRRHCLPCDVSWTGGPACWACGRDCY